MESAPFLGEGVSRGLGVLGWERKRCGAFLILLARIGIACFLRHKKWEKPEFLPERSIIQDRQDLT
jgi:hypothetical protein